MLDKYRVSQIMALLEEGQGIKTVARMTGTARNTVRRFQRDIPHKGHHGRAWRAMEANMEAVRKLFYDCRGNCSAMLRFMKDAISMEPPGLRTLQKFCTPFRLELLQSRLTKTERFETPPRTPDADRLWGRRCLRGRGDSARPLFCRQAVVFTQDFCQVLLFGEPGKLA